MNITKYDIPFYGTYLFFKNKVVDLFIEDNFLLLCFMIGYHALKDGIVIGLLVRAVLLFSLN